MLTKNESDKNVVDLTVSDPYLIPEKKASSLASPRLPFGFLCMQANEN